jgi:hypothetical protein
MNPQRAELRRFAGLSLLPAYVNKLTLDLQHCHGIKSLKYTFDFVRTDDQRKNVYAIYAQNGVMKSSLARTFKDISKGIEPRDRIFTEKPSTCTMLDEFGNPIDPDSILVVFSFDETAKHSEKTSTLLVDPTLRAEYEALLKAEEEAKDKLLQSIQKQTKIPKKRSLEREASVAITFAENRFIEALNSAKSAVNDGREPALSDVPYESIFDEAIMSTLQQPDVQADIDEYVKRYGELLSRSVFFKKGVFEYYNASTIAKALEDHGFFRINNAVILNRLQGDGETNVTVKTREELEKVITAEKESITGDPTLRDKFEKLSEKLEKNAGLRTLRAYFVNNEHLIPRLKEIQAFRRDVWISFFKSNKELYNSLLECYETSAKRKQEILENATKQRTQWDDVIQLFNSRFDVPFVLKVQNHVEVMVGAETEPRLGFEYKDANDRREVTQEQLLQVLSTGEKKAFYLLSVIFQIQVRRESKQETIFVMDDLADSFDYKNKYAIIQYLKEVADEDNFRLLVLTHNFDFYRIANGRFVVPYSHCLMARKTDAGVVLERASGIQNPFVKDWKKNKFSDSKKKIASIAFFRNLIEYFKGEEDTEYLKLTSLLHWKSDTPNIMVSELDQMFAKHFGVHPTATADKPVFELIEEQANECLSSSGVGFGLERKIVLSIAIRLNAERYMIDKIADSTAVNNITSAQTQQLIDLYKQKHPNDAANLRVLNDVALMTPENIHLNSFMYEPILDMSEDHLCKLYKEVKALQ